MSLRVIHTQCAPELVWTRNGANGSMIFQGSMVFVLTDILRLAGIPQSEVVMVPPLQDPLAANPALQFQMMAMGAADFTIFTMPFARQMIPFVDFAPMSSVLRTVIGSRRQEVDLNGNFLSGMFDYATYGTIVASLVALQVFISFWWNTSGLTSFFNSLQIMFNSGWGDVQKGKKLDFRSSGVLVLFFSCQFIMVPCFSGQMFSQLLNKGKADNIDTLEDLIARPELKIIVYRGTPYQDLMVKLKEETGFKNEIDVRDPSPDPNDFLKVDTQHGHP